ncbi:MAG TPA: YggS family pyridoxal phosphate-dependent enzyme [Actinoplanes sp.]|nr:YggS family pyridoxal phosphate-dependent enzyme [Actinoplanes sp.]
MDDPARRAELATALGEVRARIERACTAAGREPAAVTLIAVTKTYPASDVLALAGLGVADVGENRDQEAAGKAAEVAAAGVDVRWHYVGRLQRNKCRSVVRYAAAVHSVDSLRLVTALDDASRRAVDAGVRAGVVDTLVQVSLDADPSRGGAVPAAAEPERDLWAITRAVAAAPGLRLAGLMAVAPLHGEPERAFADLAQLSARLRAEHPDADAVSAGMSGDLEAAVRYGATHVRIGSALLGMRNTLR